MDALLKAVLYLGTTLLLGAGFFGRWIGPELAGPSRERLRAGLLVGAILIIAGSLLDAAAALSRVNGAFEAAMFPSYLMETRHGNAVLVRLGVVLLLAGLGAGASRRAAFDTPAFLFLALVVLTTFSVTSHAAGLGRVMPVLADLAHMIAMVAWAGAILYLAWLPNWPAKSRSNTLVTSAVHRVSTVGLASVILLAITGMYASAIHLGGPSALTGTSYGRALLLKVGAVAIVLSIAGINRWILVPAVSTGRALVKLRTLIRVESALLLAVLGLTGILTTRPLPEPPATLAEVITFRETGGAWTVRGSMSPRSAGGFNLEMSVLDAAGAVPANQVDVAVVLVMQDHDMAPIDVQASRIGRSAFRAVVPLPMAGRWQLSIRLPGGLIRIPLQATAMTAAGGAGWGQAAPGLLAMLAGAMLSASALRRIGERAKGAWPMLAGGAGGIALGVILFARTIGGAPPSDAGALNLQNPVPATPQSVAIGQRVYQQHCQACHGITGAGDGPVGRTLNPRPADLRVHMAAGHTDGELFNWISEGFKGTAMPAFKRTLTAEDRWHVLNFLRTFALTDR